MLRQHSDSFLINWSDCSKGCWIPCIHKSLWIAKTWFLALKQSGLPAKRKAPWPYLWHLWQLMTQHAKLIITDWFTQSSLTCSSSPVSAFYIFPAQLWSSLALMTLGTQGHNQSSPTHMQRWNWGCVCDPYPTCSGKNSLALGFHWLHLNVLQDYLLGGGKRILESG